MTRKDTLYYIRPSLIDIVPNANNSPNDLAVYIQRGTKIKVYCPASGIHCGEDNQYQEWTLTGRNRRLNGGSGKYAIYARITKPAEESGVNSYSAYLIFSPYVLHEGEWLESHSHITSNGLSDAYHMGGKNVETNPSYWYVKLGEVSEVSGGKRTVTLDTGILGTDQYNIEFDITPDSLPFRVEIEAQVSGQDGGTVPYVPWGRTIRLIPNLVRGWNENASESVGGWSVSRNTGNQEADAEWNASHRIVNDYIDLVHILGSDDFDGAVSAMFTLTAYGRTTSDNSDDSTEEDVLAFATITILAEAQERYELVLSSNIVRHTPNGNIFSPERIDVNIRGIRQDNTAHLLTRQEINAVGLSLFRIADPTDASVGYDSSDGGDSSDGDYSDSDGSDEYVPSDYYDEVPVGFTADGTARIIASTVFTSHQDVQLTLRTSIGGVVIDTASIVHIAEGDVWTIDSDGYWCKNGRRYRDPVTYQYILAEGQNGTGVRLSGSVDVLFEADKTAGQTSLEGLAGMSIGDCYVVSQNRHLYFYDGTTASVQPDTANDILGNPYGWRDLGEFMGQPGKTAYVHIAYAESITYDSGGTVSEVIGFSIDKQHNRDYDWIGLRTDNEKDDPGSDLNPQDSDYRNKALAAARQYAWNYIRGPKADSPWTADLDNEMDSVACDADGHPIQIGGNSQTVSAAVTLYHGETPVLPQDINYSVLRNGSEIGNDDGVACVWDNGVLTITYGTNATINGKDEFDITLQCTEGDSTIVRTVKLTVNAVKGGVIYRLVPNARSVVRHGGSSYTPTSVSCSYSKFDIQRGEYVPVIQDECAISYMTDDSQTENALTGAVAPGSQFSDRVTFLLKKNGQIIDRETVPIVSDGQPGRAGNDGQDMRENLIDNSEPPFAVSVASSVANSNGRRYFTTDKVLRNDLMPQNGTKMSGRMRIVFDGCSFGENAVAALYIAATNISGRETSWTSVAELRDIASNGSYDVTREGFELDYGTGGVEFTKFVWLYLDGFGSEGTVRVERVKLEVGEKCSAYCLSEHDKIGPAGANGSTPIQLFKWFGKSDVIDTPKVSAAQWNAGTIGGGWSKTAPNRQSGKGLYMSQNTLYGDGTIGTWSTPVCISGDDGEPGTDAKEREWIYIGKSEPTVFSENELPANIRIDSSGTPRDEGYIATQDDFIPKDWSDNAIATDGISNKFVYAAWRAWNTDTKTWGAFSAPILWSNWGVQGIDGDGVQYIYKLFSNELSPEERNTEKPSNKEFNTTTNEWMPYGGGVNAGWSDEPLAPTNSQPYCYCSVIKKINNAWGEFGPLALWSKWAKDGDTWTIGADGYWYKNGVKTEYKAEGDNGTGIDLKGTVDVVFTGDKSTGQTSLEELDEASVGDCYMVQENGWLYFYDGTSAKVANDGDTLPKSPAKWTPVGRIKGEPGESNYVHIAYADGVTLNGSGIVTAITGFSVDKQAGHDYAWMGICTTSSDADPGRDLGTNPSQHDLLAAANQYAWNYVRGANGENAIRLALDNEHEDFLYNDAGTLIAPNGGATSQARLYDGATPVPAANVNWSISERTGVPAANKTGTPIISSSGMLSIPSVTGATAKVTVKAEYPKNSGRFYYAAFTANRTSQDKYDLIVEPSSIAYNTASYTQKRIRIYANVTTLAGATTRANISSTGSLRLFAAYGGDAHLVDKTEGGKQYLDVTPAIAASNDGIYFELRKYSGSEYVVVDYETVEIAKVENGTSPTIEIRDGEWYINGQGTGVVAEGKNGTGIDLKGTVPTMSDLANIQNPKVGDCYMTEDNGILYIYDGMSPATGEPKPSPAYWTWLGAIKGEMGDSSYIHIAYANSITFGSEGEVSGYSGFTTVKPAGTNYPWMGLCANHSTEDPGNNWGSLSEDGKWEAVRSYQWNYVKGAAGENALRLDLDNEMDSIPCDSTGKVLSQVELVTHARIYDGSSPVTNISSSQNLSVGKIGDVSAKPSMSSGVGTIKWTIPAGTTLQSDRYTAQITWVYNGVTYYGVFTAIAIKSGAPGVSPDVVQLKPSRTAVNFGKNEQTSATVKTLTCGYVKVSNGETAQSDNAESVEANGISYRIYYRFGSSGDWSGYSSALSIPGDTAYTSVEFVLCTSTGGTVQSPSGVIDRETVPIVKDGKDGSGVLGQYSADGTSWHDGYQNGDKYMRISEDGGITWSDAVKIVGENGGETDYSFNISSDKTTSSVTTSPVHLWYSEWQDAPVQPTSSYPYLWAKVQKKHGDGSNDGDATYIRLTGEKGDAGDSITKVSETRRYAVTESNGSQPTVTGNPYQEAQLNRWYGSREKVTPLWTENRLLWTETAITWSDGSTTTLYSAERNPNDGQPGQAIVVDGTSVAYCLSENNTQPDNDDFGSYPANLTKGWYLWYKVTTYYRKANSVSGAHDAGSTVTYSVSYIAQDGDVVGARGITSVTEHYKASSKGNNEATPSSSGTDWETTPMPSDWGPSKPYLWNYEKIVYSNDDVTRTPAGIVAIWTENGKGIDSITNFYKKSSSASGVGYPLNDPDGLETAHSGGSETGWSTAVQVPDASEPYLWNYERVTWIEPDGTNSYTYTTPHVIGHFGKDGTSPWLADLDNEMDSVACDVDGHPVLKAGNNQTVSTNVKLYHGSAAESFTINSVKRNSSSSAGTDVTVKIDGTAAMSTNTSSPSHAISVTYGTRATINGKDDFEITLSYGSGSGADTRVLHFTVNGVRPGSNGQPAVTYNLLPSPTQVRVARTEGGGYSPATVALACGYRKSVGDTILSIADAKDIPLTGGGESSYSQKIIDETYNIYFRKRSRSNGAWGNFYHYHYYKNSQNADATHSINEVDTATYDAVEFIISTNTGRSLSENQLTGVIDRETVPLVADGMDGTGGQPGKDTSYITVRGGCYDGTTSVPGGVTIYNGDTHTTTSITADDIDADPDSNRKRGVALVLIDRTTLAVYKIEDITSVFYDTGSNMGRLADLVNSVNGDVSSDYFVCLFSQHNTYLASNRNIANVADMIESVGGVTYELEQCEGYYPFAFIGHKGLPKGFAAQKLGTYQQQTPVEVTAFVADGNLLTAKNGEDGENTRPNLLDGTGFIRNMDAWSTQEGGAVEGGMYGQKAWHYDNSDNAANTKNLLEQTVWPEPQRIRPGAWHTLSFWTFGTGSLIAYIYPSAVNTAADFYVDGKKKSTTPSDGMAEVELMAAWTRHTVTFFANSTLETSAVAEKVLFRAAKSSDVYISCPKLEEGMSASEWCLSEADKRGDDGATLQLLTAPDAALFEVDYTGAAPLAQRIPVDIQLLADGVPCTLSEIAFAKTGASGVSVVNSARGTSAVSSPITGINAASKTLYLYVAQNAAESNIKGSILFTATGTANGKTYTAKGAVSVATSKTGSPGKTGPMLYPAGEWDASTQYTIQNDCVPYVLFGDNFYYLLQDASGSTQRPDNGEYWAQMPQTNVVFTRFLIANYGNIAAAIFCGDWMYSQYGTLHAKSGGTETVYIVDETYAPDATVRHWKFDTPYPASGNERKVPFAWFDASDPMAEGSYTGARFAPNWAVDMKTGNQIGAGGGFRLGADGMRLYPKSGNSMAPLRLYSADGTRSMVFESTTVSGTGYEWYGFAATETVGANSGDVVSLGVRSYSDRRVGRLVVSNVKSEDATVDYMAAVEPDKISFINGNSNPSGTPQLRMGVDGNGNGYAENPFRQSAADGPGSVLQAKGHFTATGAAIGWGYVGVPAITSQSNAAELPIKKATKFLLYPSDTGQSNCYVNLPTLRKVCEAFNIPFEEGNLISGKRGFANGFAIELTFRVQQRIVLVGHSDDNDDYAGDFRPEIHVNDWGKLSTLRFASEKPCVVKMMLEYDGGEYYNASNSTNPQKYKIWLVSTSTPLVLSGNELVTPHSSAAPSGTESGGETEVPGASDSSGASSDSSD